MLCKFLRLIHTLLTCFETEKKEDPDYYKYNFGDQELAWNLNEFPTPEQVHGLYHRVRHLSSPYIIAFEEMMTTGFLPRFVSSTYGPETPIHQAFIRRRLIDADITFWPPHITSPEEQREQHEMYKKLRWINVPERQDEITLKTVLEKIGDLERTVLRTSRGGRPPRQHPRQMRGQQPAGQRPAGPQATGQAQPTTATRAQGQPAVPAPTAPTPISATAPTTTKTTTTTTAAQEPPRPQRPLTGLGTRATTQMATGFPIKPRTKSTQGPKEKKDKDPPQ